MIHGSCSFTFRRRLIAGCAVDHREPTTRAYRMQTA
jgi:hypothetical protein